MNKQLIASLERFDDAALAAHMRFTVRVLSIFNWIDADTRHSYFCIIYPTSPILIDWRVDCSDVFLWGCSDSHGITPGNIESLEQTVKDIEVFYPEHAAWSPLLWVARERGVRPQGAFYAEIPEVLWPLFNDVGPHRPAEPGNPVATPSVPE